MGRLPKTPLTGLQGLRNLDLWRTSVTDIAPLARLKGLARLGLFGCRPAVPAWLLPALAEQPRLTELVVDEAIGVPQEVLSHASYDNCLPRVRAYLAELKFGAEAENEVKV